MLRSTQCGQHNAHGQRSSQINHQLQNSQTSIPQGTHTTQKVASLPQNGIVGGRRGTRTSASKYKQVRASTSARPNWTSELKRDVSPPWRKKHLWAPELQNDPGGPILFFLTTVARLAVAFFRRCYRILGPRGLFMFFVATVFNSKVSAPFS